MREREREKKTGRERGEREDAVDRGMERGERGG